MKPEMHHIPELDRRGLRQFALLTGAIVSGLFGLFLPWLFNFAWPIWPWIASGVLVLVGMIAPLALQPVYTLWMRFGLALNRITTPVIMALVFFLVLTPTGLIRRIVSADPMARKFHEEESYRIPSKKASAANMERPF